MDKEFKEKLLTLYPNYDRVTGPYLRNDGRKHIVLNNSTLPTKTPGKLRTLSWPKALMEVKLGRLLLENETVDHENEDFTNDDEANLQVLSRRENIIKSFKNNPERMAEWYLSDCSICGKEFIKPKRIFERNRKEGKAGPFCSKSCAGKYGTDIQNGRLAQLVEAADLSSVK